MVDPSPFLTALATTGPVGAIAVLAMLAAWYKDRQAGKEMAARIADAQATTQLLLQMQKTTIDTVNKLADVVGELKEMNRDRERIRRGGV